MATSELPPVKMRLVVDADDALEKITQVREALDALVESFGKLTASINIVSD